jgi:hypothetical protein
MIELRSRCIVTSRVANRQATAQHRDCTEGRA